MKIVFGTWMMGGNTKPDPNNNDKRDIDAIKHAIKSGITHIDTAENYADGKAEELVREAIKGFDRKKLFIATKVGADKLAYNDVIKSCKRSLKNLGVSHIDLFYVHKPNPNIPMGETAKALNELLATGLIKNIGLSNVKIETIERYAKLLSKPIYAVQNQYSLICRESQNKGIIDYCKKNGIQFYSWRPIRLSYPENTLPPTPDSYEILTKMARKYSKTPTQIAVRWLSQQDEVNVLFKSTNAKHIDEIVDTENFKISKEDWEKLSKEFPIQKNQSFTAAGYFDVL